ncbi:MAG: transposase [Thermodesulfobacteriota bacterium]
MSLAVRAGPAQPLAIRRIQDLGTEKGNRLHHRVQDRRVPPDNNLAERDLSSSVIARKTSCGSSTDAGARTRSLLTSLLQTMKKTGPGRRGRSPGRPR